MGRTHVVKLLVGLLLALWAFGYTPARGEAQEPPPAPVLVSPADGARTTGLTDPPNGTPTFYWARVPGATSYQIQISTSAGFSQVTVEATTDATTYTPTEALSDGTYYWRVRARAGKLWGPFSEVWSFEKDWSAGGQLKPQPLAPVPGATITDFNEGFRWTPVQGAAMYLFEIDDSPYFTSVDYSALTLKPAHTPLSKLGNARYYWRVIPIDPQENYGAAMDPVSFTLDWNYTPTLLAPEHEAVLSFTPTFEWTAVPGADYYILELDTNPSFTDPTTYQTRNTAFTPERGLSNDEDYYWRVQAVDAAGNSGPYSEVRRFRLRWDFAPRLLTPTNNWVSVSYPIFRWTPVPGAYQYQIQVDDSLGFSAPLKVDKKTYFTTYIHENWGNIKLPGTYYWRVRALDAQGNPGPWSAIYAFSFALEMAPKPLYPPFYYTVDDTLTPVHDRVDVTAPLFLWDTAHDESTVTQPYTAATHYVLEVDDSPLFTSPNFRVETAALGAAPTDDQPFTDFQYGKTYYWRVTAYIGNRQLGYPTVWQARFAQDAPGPESTTDITLLYPDDNTSWVVDAPVLGWAPVQGAKKYRVQVSFTPDFTDLLYDVTTAFTHFVPGQDRVSKLPNRTYWWRVRVEDPQGPWGEVRAFRITHHLMTGNPFDYAPPDPLHQDTSYINRVLEDEPAGQTPYDLNSLWVVQDRYYDNTALRWILDLVSYASAGVTLEYVIYVDVDHRPDVGATTDPQGRPIAFPAKERPDVAIDLRLNADGTINPAVIWTYTGDGWGIPQDIRAIGGRIVFDPDTDALQVYLPYTVLGGGDPDWDGALGFAVVLYDANGTVRDVMPGTGTDRIPYFAYTSDLLNPVLPFNYPFTTFAFRDFPLLQWHMPYWGSVDGYEVEVARDVDFTDVIQTWKVFETAFGYPSLYGFLPAAYMPLTPLGDNETYYWRVRLKHEIYNKTTRRRDSGPYTRPARFTVRSLAPANLQPADGATVSRTPVFRWDRVQNAGRYRFQLDDDANFSSPIINRTVDTTAYIPPEMSFGKLRDGVYYWRVAVVRGSTQGPWSPVHTFTKVSPAPTPLSPVDDAVIHEIPTLRWTAVLTPTDTPRLSAPRYRVELDTNPNFSSPLWFITEATSLTLPKGKAMEDGTWYWRVALVRAGSLLGPYSPPARFYKEYPAPRVIAPANGAVVSETPTFEWEPVDGAASYRLELSQDENFSSVKKYDTDNTRFTPTTALKKGTWYWRVRIRDAERRWGPYAQGMIIVGHREAFPYILAR